MKGENHYQYQLLLPMDPFTLPNDRARFRPRDWVLSGERVLLFLEVHNIVGHGEPFPFLCGSINCNIRDPRVVTINRPQMTRCSSVSSVTTKPSSAPENHHESVIPMFIERLTSSESLPNPVPIYENDGTSYFPVKFTIPLTQDDHITIGAFRSLSESHS